MYLFQFFPLRIYHNHTTRKQQNTDETHFYYQRTYFSGIIELMCVYNTYWLVLGQSVKTLILILDSKRTEECVLLYYYYYYGF